MVPEGHLRPVEPIRTQALGRHYVARRGRRIGVHCRLLDAHPPEDASCQSASIRKTLGKIARCSIQPRRNVRICIRNLERQDTHSRPASWLADPGLTSGRRCTTPNLATGSSIGSSAWTVQCRRCHRRRRDGRGVRAGRLQDDAGAVLARGGHDRRRSAALQGADDQASPTTLRELAALVANWTSSSATPTDRATSPSPLASPPCSCTVTPAARPGHHPDRVDVAICRRR